MFHNKSNTNILHIWKTIRRYDLRNEKPKVNHSGLHEGYDAFPIKWPSMYTHTHTQYKTPCYMIFSILKPNSEKRRKKGLILKNMWRGKKCLWRFKSQSIEEILEFVPNAKSNCEYEHKLTCIFDLEQWKATIFSPRIDFQASFQLPWKQSSPKELKKGSSWEVA